MCPLSVERLNNTSGDWETIKVIKPGENFNTVLKSGNESREYQLSCTRNDSKSIISATSDEDSFKPEVLKELKEGDSYTMTVQIGEIPGGIKEYLRFTHRSFPHAQIRI